MGLKRCEVFGFVVIMVTVMVMRSGEATYSGCKSAIVSLSPCISYVCGNSSTPSMSCCSQLANVVKSQPRCLCALVNGGHGHSSMGFKINQTLALGLPDACSVHTPPVSRCDGSGSGSGSGSGNGTENVPPAKSDGTIINLPFYFSVASLLVTVSMYV
ncbi:putative plant lipid transfer protein/Par allergen [Helianthus anomalus]